MRSARVRCPTVWLRLLAVVASAAGCVAVTINVTFPQEEIDNAASSIEELVRTPPTAPAPSPPPGKRDGAGPGAPGGARVAGTAWAWLAPAAAEAQVPDLKTRTPEVNAVIESRRARFARIGAAVAAGCLGENNQGLLEPRPGSGCPPDAATLAADENRDRMVLYRTLVEQNNMPSGDLARVQAAFARAHRERAPAGAWVQNEAGEWSRK
jgi:uncharacterized protein YdbL (DUF1318 family)